MKNIKHVGRLKTNNAKVLVVFRTLPGDPYYALVVGTSNLSDQYHNTLMTLVESDQAQDANELGEIMGIRYFTDGRAILAALHQDGRLAKVPTTDVIMTPNTTTEIGLSELNTLIAEQKGVAVDDLAMFIGNDIKPFMKDEKVEKVAPEVVSETVNAPVSVDSASDLRSKADALYKEAAKLRKQADDLDPPKKKAVKAKETSDA